MWFQSNPSVTVERRDTVTANTPTCRACGEAKFNTVVIRLRDGAEVRICFMCLSEAQRKAHGS